MIALTITLAFIAAFCFTAWQVMESAYLAERRKHEETRGALRIAFAAIEVAHEALTSAPIPFVPSDDETTPIGDETAVHIFRTQLDADDRGWLA